MLELLAKLRRETGEQNRRVRKQGFIPAILYGREVKNALLSVNEQDFKKIYKETGASALIKLKISDPLRQSSSEASGEQNIEGGNERVVLIQDTAKDPVSDRVIHIDFNQVKMDEETTVEVPLVFVGKSIAVEREGGVLVKNIQSIEVKALPRDLPKQIEVDISIIKSFDDNLRVKDLKIPENIKIEAKPDDIVASVVPPRTSEELEGLEQAPVEKTEEVEVEQKGKEKQEADQGEGDSVSEEKTPASGGGGNE